MSQDTFDEKVFDEKFEAFKKLIFVSYDHVRDHPQREAVVDDLVNWASARFSNEPNYAVVIAVWNALNNCIVWRPNPLPDLPHQKLLQ